jgi:hypothetical protein
MKVPPNVAKVFLISGGGAIMMRMVLPLAKTLMPPIGPSPTKCMFMCGKTLPRKSGRMVSVMEKLKVC